MAPNAGLQNTERPIKCELGHLTSPNFLDDAMSSLSRHCPSFKSFLKGKLSKSFEIFFLRCSDVHTNPTRFSNAESLYMPRCKSVTYGMNSITNICINSWNNITEILEKPSTLSISELKKDDVRTVYFTNPPMIIELNNTLIAAPLPSPFCHSLFLTFLFL